MDIETIATPADKQEVINMVKEASAALLRIDAEKDLIKDIATRAKDDFLIPAAEFNKITKMYHKQNRDEQIAKHEKTDSLYEKLFDE